MVVLHPPMLILAGSPTKGTSMLKSICESAIIWSVNGDLLFIVGEDHVVIGDRAVLLRLLGRKPSICSKLIYRDDSLVS